MATAFQDSPLAWQDDAFQIEGVPAVTVIGGVRGKRRPVITYQFPEAWARVVDLAVPERVVPPVIVKRRRVAPEPLPALPAEVLPPVTVRAPSAAFVGAVAFSVPQAHHGLVRVHGLSVPAVFRPVTELSPEMQMIIALTLPRPE